MVASIGKIVSAAQGVSYYERDGYYAKDDPAHREASAWTGRAAAALGLSGSVDPETFTADSHQCSRSFSLNVATYSQQSSHPLSAWQPPRSEATRLR